MAITKDRFDQITTKILNIVTAFRIGGVDVTSTAAELNALSGVTLTPTQINLLLQGVAGGYKLARGQRTMLSASDTVATGLTTVIACIALMESDPILTFDRATSQIGNQSGAPVAGSIIIKGWMPTGGALTTPIAATGFSGIKVNWIAVGT